jgi:methylthioribose-1-phosphate isomerase
MPFKIEDHRLWLVDQRLLPAQLSYFDATELFDTAFAIEQMVVRGAPSIGLVAAYGLAFEVERICRRVSQAQAFDRNRFLFEFTCAVKLIGETRPTAVNLHYSLQMVSNALQELLMSNCEGCELAQALSLAAFAQAQKMVSDNLQANLLLSEAGGSLIAPGARILTHCNAGALAAGGYGTSLGVIRHAFFAGKNLSVWVDETRPRNQGAKLTMYELMADCIPATLICDNMSGHLMASGKVDMVITGADRIACNGDTANKIGTYNLAVLAHYHKIPFYIAAPLSTFDPDAVDGSAIPIEERAASEVIDPTDGGACCANAQVYNPAFDVTGAHLISGIICQAGILRAPYTESIARVLG